MVNSTIDGLTNTVVVDSGPRSGLLPGVLSSAEAMSSGIRVRPADLSRLLGVSRQAVSNWVKDGRVVLGHDGRVDPAAAVRRLLATGDSSRLRARCLAPILVDLAAAQRRVAELERQSAQARDDAEFSHEACMEALALFGALVDALRADWAALRAMPADLALGAIERWRANAEMFGPGGAGIAEHARAIAYAPAEGGADAG